MADDGVLDLTVGNEPYVLIIDKSTEDELALDIKGGGGLADQSDIVGLVLHAVEQLTGVSAKPYLAAIRGQRVVDRAAERHGSGPSPLVRELPPLPDRSAPAGTDPERWTACDQEIGDGLACMRRLGHEGPCQ